MNGSGAPVLTGILGSGFGLYGWLPAVLAAGSGTVVVPSRYAAVLDARPELAACRARVALLPDDEAVLAVAERLVIARRPADQERAVGAALRHASIRELVLEKPFAPDPEAARALLDAAIGGGRVVRAGWSLAPMPWAAALRTALAAPVPCTIRIRWAFEAHHYRAARPTWKRRHAEGGGVVRFFGIQLLAALTAGDGAVHVEHSRIGTDTDGEPARWCARLRLGADGRHRADVEVESDATVPSFTIDGCPGPPVTCIDPFDREGAAWTADRRVDLLAALLRAPADEATHAWHRRTVAAWAAVERATDVSGHPAAT